MFFGRIRANNGLQELTGREDHICYIYTYLKVLNDKMFVNNKNVCMYSNAEAFNFSAFELRFTMDRRDSVTHICTILAAHVTEMCIHKLWEDVKDECSNV